jgi:biotin carboxylase
MQDRIRHEVARACAAAGLVTGPIHAEVRVNDQGIWMLEVAARSIGGLCGRVLKHSLGVSLEELILRQAVGQPLPIAGAEGAAGVMMIPVPRRGIYDGVEGLTAARSVPFITGVNVTAEQGQGIAPPPDGAGYLGFIFARAASPAEAEAALRRAHGKLRFDIRAGLPVDAA